MTRLEKRCGIVNSHKATALTLVASILLVATSAFGQAAPGVQTFDINQQLDIPASNGTQGEQRNQADFLLRLGGEAQSRGDLEKAIANWLQALDLYDQTGDLEGLGRTYGYLGVAYAKLGRYQQAEDALRRRVGVARTLQDFQGQIYGLNNLGTVLLQRSNYQAAQDTFTEAQAIARSVNNQQGEGLSLSNLGLVAAARGSYFEAIKRYQAALALRSQVGDPLGEANTRNNLGDTYRAASLPRDAIPSYRAARRVAQDSRDVPNQFRALRGLAQAYTAVGQYPLAFDALAQHIALAEKERNRTEQLYSLQLSAVLNQATGNLADARNYYERAIGLASALGDTQEEALLRNDLAQIIYSYPRKLN